MELKMNRLVCAFVKTIGLLVGVVLFPYFRDWLDANVSFFTIIQFLERASLTLGIIGSVLLIFLQIYDSCEKSNQQTAKKTATNVNQTVKKTAPTQSNTKTCNTVTQNTTSAQFDVKQYPVLDEIQKIISNLSELEKDNDLDKNMFAKFHKLKEQFDEDYQKTIKILTKLDKFKSINEKHLRVFKHYLDLFKEEKDYIYKQIEQNYDNEIDAIYNNLDNIND